VERLQKSCYLAGDGRLDRLEPRARLLAQYLKDGLVLFLGAGVSVGSGIPNWKCLSEKMLERAVADPPQVDLLKRELPQLTTQFDLTAHWIPAGKKKFAEALYECLYGRDGFKALKSLLTHSQTEPTPSRPTVLGEAKG